MEGSLDFGSRQPPRGLGRFAWEMVHAFVDGARWGFRELDWRHEQELALVRVFVLGALGSIARARAMTDMVRGAKVVYLVEPGFDEVSHRRGPQSKQALRELSGTFSRAVETVPGSPRRREHAIGWPRHGAGRLRRGVADRG